MKYLKLTIISVSILISGLRANSQTNANELIKTTDTIRSLRQTSIKTDILPEVFQALVNNGILSTSGSSVKVNTTIFGLKKLFNPGVAIDSNYINEKFSRNFAFGGGINMDNTNKINGINSSIKWAIINHRDVSDISLPKYQEINDTLNNRIRDLVIDLSTSIASHIQDAINRHLLSNQDTATVLTALRNFTNSSGNENAIGNLKQALLPFSQRLNIDPGIFDRYPTANKIIKKLADSLENIIKKRAILTFGYNSDYLNNKWDTLSLKLEWIKGLGGKKDSTKPWDMYAGAFYTFRKDTLTKQTLQKQLLSVKLGLNKVLAIRKDGGPLFEIFGGAQFDYIAKGNLYKDEKRNSLAADFTFTVKVSKAVSVPLEIKYDPNNKGNFYGFLNFKWDILTSPSK